MKIQSIIRKSAISLFVFSALIMVGGYWGHNFKLLLAILCYAFFTYYFISNAKSKTEKRLVVLILILPPLIYIPIHIFNFKSTLISLPSSSAHFMGIAMGLILSNLYGKIKYILGTMFIIMTFWLTFIGYPKWINKINYNTFSGHVSYKVPHPFSCRDQLKNHINNDNLRGKIVLLDFWNTKCGVCFEKFPLLQKLFTKYQNNQNVMIYALDAPLISDSLNEAFLMIEQRKYTFNVLMPDDIHLPERFGVLSYPTTIVIDRSGNIVFKGDIEQAASALDHLLFYN